MDCGATPGTGATVTQDVTFVMYHYVRDRGRHRFPRVNALDKAEFDGQLDYIASRYTVIGVHRALEALAGRAPLPDNACVLTFDDGLLDHYETVFPALRKRGWTGAFYPIAKTTWQDVVVDVHKIHFILASVEDEKMLYDRVLALLPELRKTEDFPDDPELLRVWAHPNRFDTAETIFVKRAMQTALPPLARRHLVDCLFDEFVPDDEAVLSRETYLRPLHIREMVDGGMEFGGHGYSHEWLGEIDPRVLDQELALTVDFLADITGKQDGWVMCYPSGSYSDLVIEKLKLLGFSGGLTTNVRLAGRGDDPFEIPRIDTKDLPMSAAG